MVIKIGSMRLSPFVFGDSMWEEVYPLERTKGPFGLKKMINHLSSLITHHLSLKNTLISYNFVWVEYLSGHFNSNTRLYVTHWVPQKSICRSGVQNGYKPTRVVSLSLLFTPFPQQNMSPTSEIQNETQISNLCAQKPSIINRSELWLENTPVPLSIWTWLKVLVGKYHSSVSRSHLRSSALQTLTPPVVFLPLISPPPLR